MGKGETQDQDTLSAAARLAHEIKQRRLGAKLSQPALAERIGYSRQYVSLAERPGANVPSSELVRALDAELEADGALITLRAEALAERVARRPAARRRTTPSREGTTSALENGAVLVPVMINGLPALMPVDPGEPAGTVGTPGIGPPNYGIDAGEWEAMSPLNRRLVLQRGLSAAAMSLAAGHSPPPPSPFDRTSGQRPTTTPPASSWARSIYDAVLNPSKAMRDACADESFTPGRPRYASALTASTADVMAAHLRSDYLSLSTALPQLLGHAESLNLSGDASAQPVLSDVYGVAAWSLIKADSPVAAWIAAQRSIEAAERAEDLLRQAAATRCLSEVHMRAGQFDDATRSAFLATIHLESTRSTHQPTAITLRGAALLSGAAAAARAGNTREAHAALHAAAVCADELGENRTDLATFFGPANVAIHQVAIAVELGDTKTAARHIPTVAVNTLPAAMAERRARFLIDVARTHRGHHDDHAALDALLQAERIAPHELREHRLTHDLLRDLLTRERRSSGVRELAARCGALN